MRLSNIICRGPTRRPPRFTIFKTLLFSGLLASCAGDTTEFVDGAGGWEEPEEFLLGTTSQALGSADPKCFEWGLAEKTLTGGGEFLSPATYDPAGCHQAYRFNLVDYDGVKYNAGTVVGYGGAIPTTEAACTSSTVRAYVWLRGSNNAMTYLGRKHANGRWYVGLDGVGRCRPAVINIERDIPGIVPNGARDYRIATTARSRETNATVPVAFATVEDHVITPTNLIKNSATYRTKLDSHSGTNLEPVLQAIWNRRGTPVGQMMCRQLDVNRGLHAFTRAALIKAGATAATVDARTTALGNFRTALCTSGGTTANLHSAVTAYYTQALAISDQLRSGLQTAWSGGAPASRNKLAANLMSQVTDQALGTLISKCDLNAEPLSRFLLHGTLPAGVTDATRVVLGACAGQNPAQAAAAVGFGAATPGVPNALTAMAQCMADLVADASETRCSSPRTTDAPAADEEPADVCWNGTTFQECDLTIEDKLAELKAKREANEKAGEARQAEAIAASMATPIATTKELGKQLATDVGFGLDVIFKLAATSAALNPEPLSQFEDRVTMIMVGSAMFLVKVAGEKFPEQFYEIFGPGEPAPAPTKPAEVKQWCESTPGAFQLCDGYQGISDYCPADPVLTAAGMTRSQGEYWFQTGGPNAPRQATKQDLFNHCLCNMLDADYSAIGRGEVPARAPATSCPQSEEQRKLECVADPRVRPGDDDRPDFACLGLLSPGTEDPNFRRASDCDKKLCLQGQEPFAKTNGLTGECVCEPVTPGSATFPTCSISPRASSGMCTDESPQACFCEPIFPLPPNGGDPFCRQRGNTVLGPVSSWLAPDSTALRLSTFDATTDVVRVRAGGNTQFATSVLYPNTFPVRGTSIQQKVAIFKAPGTGQNTENVDLKVYYTNPSKGVFRQFLDMCRMNTFTVGALTNCNFPLPTINGVNAGALEDPFFLEMEIDTAVTYKTRPALGPTGFSGTPITTPANKLAPNCPMPDPGAVVTISNPLPPLLGLDDLFSRPIYLSPSGDELIIRPSLPVVRVLDL